MKSFQDKIVWITGATSGIGEELALRLSELGARLIISARRIEELERVRNLCKNPNHVFVLPLDLEQSENFDELARTVIDVYGRIDYLFNNGGVSQRATVENTTMETERSIMEVNYFGNIALSKAVLPYMILSKKGHLVVTSSVAGKFGFFLRASYSASKHALHGYYDTLRLEQMKNNIKVTLLVPGAINTHMSSNAKTGDGKKHGKHDRMQSEGMDVGKAVGTILRAVQKEKEEVVFGGREPLAVWIKRIFPGRLTGILAKRNPTA